MNFLLKFDKFKPKFTLLNAKIYKISKIAKKIHAQGVNLSAFCIPFSVLCALLMATPAAPATAASAAVVMVSVVIVAVVVSAAAAVRACDYAC